MSETWGWSVWRGASLPPTSVISRGPGWAGLRWGGLGPRAAGYGPGRGPGAQKAGLAKAQPGSATLVNSTMWGEVLPGSGCSHLRPSFELRGKADTLPRGRVGHPGEDAPGTTLHTAVLREQTGGSQYPSEKLWESNGDGKIEAFRLHAVATPPGWGLRYSTAPTVPAPRGPGRPHPSPSFHTGYRSRPSPQGPCRWKWTSPWSFAQDPSQSREGTCHIRSD